MTLDLEIIKKTYFYFDLPVKYKLRSGDVIDINPVKVRESEIYLSSADILAVDKNSISDPKIIQMSYLQFLVEHLLRSKTGVQKFVNILFLCLDFKRPRILKDQFGRPVISDDERKINIDFRDFDDIKSIILHQNNESYDDSYINPDLKQAMADVDELKSKNYAPISIERKMAIITAHCGVSKKDQMEMTLRSHEMLFAEVAGEVEFETTRAVAAFGGHEVEHWIFKKNKNKILDYVTSVDEYAKSMGSDASKIRTSNNLSENKFIKEFDKIK